MDNTRFALLSVIVVTFLVFAGIFSNYIQVAAQSGEEPSKPPAPIRPPGTTGAAGARPEKEGPLPQQIEKNPATRGYKPYMPRREQDLEKAYRELQERQKLEQKKAPQSQPGTTKPPAPLKPPASTGSTEY